MFLHCIVGKVDHAVAGIIEVELLGGSTDVAIVIPVSLEAPVDSGDQNVASDIELSPIN